MKEMQGSIQVMSYDIQGLNSIVYAVDPGNSTERCGGKVAMVDVLPHVL